MKNPNCFPRWTLVACLLGVVTAGQGEEDDDYGIARLLPERPVVMEGRSVSMIAGGAAGSVQWQISGGAVGSAQWRASSGVGQTWHDLTDDNTYHGTNTGTLEISGATRLLDDLLYRFTDTVGGMVAVSGSARLSVSPLLFPSPTGLAIDEKGDLIVSDSTTHTLRRIEMNSPPQHVIDRGFTDTNLVFPLVGAGGLAGSADGTDTGARFNQPGGLVWSGPSDFIVADTANSTIRRVRGGTVTTLAGSVTERGNRDGAGSAAMFSNPTGVAKGPDGTCYVADTGNHTIRKIRADGMVGTLAGSPGNAGWVDGAGQAARFNRPTGIAVDANGTVYVSDTVNNLIRKITPAGVVTTLAGVPGVAGTQDGPGDQAMFNGPTGLAWDASGDLFVADTGNSTIRLIETGGTVKTYAGIPTVSGLRDGGYNPLLTLLNQPRALACDGRGTLYIADTGNAAIRSISREHFNEMKTLPLSMRNESETLAASSPVAPASGGGGGGSVSASKSAADGGSGGGSIDGWLVAALAGTWLLRKVAAGMRR